MASKEAMAAANRHLRSINLDPDTVDSTRNRLADIIDEEFAEREGLMAAHVKAIAACWLPESVGRWINVPNTGQVLIDMEPECRASISYSLGVLVGMIRLRTKKKEVPDDDSKGST